MPIVRYFLWVGGVLLTVIFIAGWVWPSAAPEPVKEASASAQMPTDPTNSMILRIQSARKLPDRIEFDTSIPTIVPPPVVAAATPPVAAGTAASPLEARAEMKQSAPTAAPPPKRVAKVHRRNVRPAVSTWAYANPQPPQWSWSNNAPRSSWNW